MTATTVEIYRCFERLTVDDLRYNWGTGTREQNDRWKVDDDTYINGVVLTVDGDYWMGYLIEVVERSSSVVSFMAINIYHGRHPDGTFTHDFISYEWDCGTFFDRLLEGDYAIVGQWAVARIFGMAEAHYENKRKEVNT
jgi:hypothetical protein